MPHELSEPQIAHYHEHGYVMTGGLFRSAELDEMERELDALVERRLRNAANIDATWAGDWKAGQPKTEILHTHDVQTYSAAWARFLLHERLTGALADLLGPNVALHHSKAFIKPPERGSAFPMHQDYPYFPHTLGTMMAAILHLSDATEEMGCFRVYPGTHKLGPLPIMDERQAYVDPAQWPIAGATPLPARRGDVVFFNYLLVHGSDINRSPRTRKTALIQVRDPADQMTVQRHDNSHALGLMLRGVNPLAHGEALATGSGL
ncbi:MAG: phytanoyl-CoA dioxygenase family protein [Phycisphaerales bacterium]|nr:phytanoyl-CoA dioxygenase family protein [Phycisphaerales bacterium]